MHSIGGYKEKPALSYEGWDMWGHCNPPPAAQALWEKPVHSARASFHSQAYPSPRKPRTTFRSAPLHYKPHDPCLSSAQPP
ncbi:hypothetical protein [Nafulsella turpanensis]|uniref:hypothetical protein n=1 Tax=Nafulsella turpanensis TaxID=1265690 RepID=UPI001267CD19|nr:hypothetical protein [Nafulsella turpanensis]